jgi:hypothetical protein
MLVLTILLFGLLVMLALAVVLIVSSGLYSLLPIVIPVVPLLLMVGSGLLGLIELLLLFGGPEERRHAKRELVYLGATFAVSGLLLWVTTRLLWRL